MAAAINIFVPVPIPIIVAAVAVVLLILQVFRSYTLIRRIFRWLALTLLAYVRAGFLSKPDLLSTLKGSIVPSIEFNKEFLSIALAIIGTTLAAYLYTWQSNEEVEEKIAEGKTTVQERKGVSDRDLSQSSRENPRLDDLLEPHHVLHHPSTGSTLHANGQVEIETAAQAAEALKPIAGDAAGYLFAAGIVSVGFLALPVMTTGAAYDLAQSFGIKGSLNATARQAPTFYVIIGLMTAIAVAMNFLGFNPMKALIWSGIVQGFSTPPLLFLILLMTNNRKIMGDQVNSRALTVLGWLTTAVIFSASAGLVVTWFL